MEEAQRSLGPADLHSHGVLFFSSKPGDYFDGSMEVHRRLGLPLEQMDGAQLQRRFPMIDFSGVIIGLYEPEFGALMARRAVQTLVKKFVASGGEYRHWRPLSPASSRRPARSLKTSDGSIEADAFVFALGPWLPKLFPDILGKKIFATRQEIFYFAPPKADRRFEPEAMPGWADFNDGDMFYGFPDLEARGVKFAHDKHGAYVDPDTQSREPTRAALDEVIAFRDRRFPLLKGAPVIGAEVCQYENSSNGDFLIDRHPAFPMWSWSAAGRATASSMGRRSAAWRPRWSRAAEPSPNPASRSQPRVKPSTAKCISPSPILGKGGIQRG